MSSSSANDVKLAASGLAASAAADAGIASKGIVFGPVGVFVKHHSQTIYIQTCVCIHPYIHPSMSVSIGLSIHFLIDG